MYDIDKAYSPEDRKGLTKAADTLCSALFIMESSDKGYHVLSFDVYRPDEFYLMEQASKILRRRFDGDFPSIAYTIQNEAREKKFLGGLCLRISEKGPIPRPSKLLDIIIPDTVVPRLYSKGHVALYSIMCEEPIDRYFKHVKGVEERLLFSSYPTCNRLNREVMEE